MLKVNGTSFRGRAQRREGDGENRGALLSADERPVRLTAHAGGEVAKLVQEHIVARVPWTPLLHPPLVGGRSVHEEAVLIVFPSQDAISADDLQEAPRRSAHVVDVDGPERAALEL